MNICRISIINEHRLVTLTITGSSCPLMLLRMMMKEMVVRLMVTRLEKTVPTHGDSSCRCLVLSDQRWLVHDIMRPRLLHHEHCKDILQLHIFRVISTNIYLVTIT